MDTELLKTFLEVSKTRHFGRAAESLYLTQSAVSFRIRQLEASLGTGLFSRQRGNIHLTTAGERLVPYAESILQTLGRAKQDVILSDQSVEQVSMGASPSVWELGGVSRWMNQLYVSFPYLALRLENISRTDLVRHLLERNIDMAILGEPPKVEGLKIKALDHFSFQLVSRCPDLAVDNLDNMSMAYLDWGMRYSIEHARVANFQVSPCLHAQSSRLILEYLLENDSVAYLPEPVISKHLDNNELFLVKDAPMMEQSLYLCWLEDNEKQSHIQDILETDFVLRTASL